MDNFKESRLNSYFPAHVIEVLENYINGRECKVIFVDRYFSRDLFSICSKRDLLFLDKNNSVIKLTKDSMIKVIYGDLTIGTISTQIKFNGEHNKIIKSEKSNYCLWNDAVLLVKHIENLNESFINVYAII